MNLLGSTVSAIETYPICETLIERAVAPSPCFPLLKDMFIEKGDKSDWELLHNLHYKAENLPIGPRFWKMTLYGETIGVLITGNSKGLLRERHIAFPKLKPGNDETRLSNTQRFMFINANFRVISRFVVDTMYRGIGAGYRMMNLASRMEGNTFMEIQSSMSKFNFFGQKAGFSFVKPSNSNKYDIGLTFYRKNFISSPQDFEALINELHSKPEYEQGLCLAECRAFYYRHSALEKIGSNRDKGRNRVAEMTDRAVIKAIQQITLASPLYGIWKNPDKGSVIPQRLPLTAFDLQKPNERLVLCG